MGAATLVMSALQTKHHCCRITSINFVVSHRMRLHLRCKTKNSDHILKYHCLNTNHQKQGDIANGTGSLEFLLSHLAWPSSPLSFFLFLIYSTCALRWMPALVRLHFRRLKYVNNNNRKFHLTFESRVYFTWTFPILQCQVKFCAF